MYEIRPSTADADEEFERLANALKAGDELILHGALYSQSGRRAVTAKGTADQPIVIRAADGETPLLTHAAQNADSYNNIEFVDCCHLVIRGLRFKGCSSGVRFIRGHHVTLEDCEIFETLNNALTMNSGNCDSFVIRRNQMHHTGLSVSGPTEGEGMYIGCHDGSCITTNSLFEGNYIHHLRSTSDGGNDGIEIKFGSYGNVVRDNVIHDTNIGRQYPGIFIYGGGKGINIVNHPRGVSIRWSKAADMVFANNVVFCPGSTAIDASSAGDAVFIANYVNGGVSGVAIDNSRFFGGADAAQVFVDPSWKNFWPAPGSPLIGRADSQFVPETDFNHAARKPPFDVGAYETEDRPENPGWTLQEGFKHTR